MRRVERLIVKTNFGGTVCADEVYLPPLGRRPLERVRQDVRGRHENKTGVLREKGRPVGRNDPRVLRGRYAPAAAVAAAAETAAAAVRADQRVLTAAAAAAVRAVSATAPPPPWKEGDPALAPTPPPPRPTTRGVVPRQICEDYGDFIGEAPSMSAACGTRACPDSPRWDVSAFGDDAARVCSANCGGGVVQRTVRCVVGGDGVSLDATALTEVDDSRCAAMVTALGPAPASDVPCSTQTCPSRICEANVCSFSGTCDAASGQCVCDEGSGKTGTFCDIHETCGSLNDELIETDDAGDCCPGVVDTNGVCCHVQLGVAVLDGSGKCCASGVVDACGLCDGPSRVVDVIGQCCAGSLDAGGHCCASGVFDQCGSCDGTYFLHFSNPNSVCPYKTDTFLFSKRVRRYVSGVARDERGGAF